MLALKFLMCTTPIGAMCYVWSIIIRIKNSSSEFASTRCDEERQWDIWESSMRTTKCERMRAKETAFRRPHQQQQAPSRRGYMPAIWERSRGPLMAVTLPDRPPRRFNLNANQNRKFAPGPLEHILLLPISARFCSPLCDRLDYHLSLAYR